MTAGSKTVLKAVLLITVSVGLSGCVYDVGLGYASDGYYDDVYGCDPYGGNDAYYDCDYGQGFANIGFGGGYYDNFYYPGYGFFLFDNVGRRYPMRDHHRRYWGEKRQYYFRELRGRDRDGRRYDGGQRGYSNDASPGVIGDVDSNDARVRSRDATGIDNRRDGRRADRREDRREWVDQRRSREGRNAESNPVTRPSRGQQEAGSQRQAPAARAVPPLRPERGPSVPRSSRDVNENVRDQ